MSLFWARSISRDSNFKQKKKKLLAVEKVWDKKPLKYWEEDNEGETKII